MAKLFFVAYRSDPLAAFALTLLKELGADGELLDTYACPNESVTLLFTPKKEKINGAFAGKKHLCTSYQRMQKHEISLPEPGETAKSFVALMPRTMDEFSGPQGSERRDRFQQALCQLDPELVKVRKKPRKRRERSKHDRYDFD